MCGSSYAGKRTKMLQIHHLDSINYKDLTPSKFRLVCSSCHDLIERMKVKKSWGQYAELWHGLLDKFMGVV
jgi:predicted HNH restriction endonuclease